MSAPDFREWADAGAWGEDWHPRLRRMCNEMAARGSTFGRVTIVEAHGSTWVCVDGWRVRPDDQGEQPTAADVSVGFA